MPIQEVKSKSHNDKEGVSIDDKEFDQKLKGVMGRRMREVSQGEMYFFTDRHTAYDMGAMGQDQVTSM